MWWRGRWIADDGSVLGNRLMQTVQELYRSIIERLARLDGNEMALELAAVNLRKYGNTMNKNVKGLVMEQLRSYALQTDPFDQKHHLFCFTNAVFDSFRGVFVTPSKYDNCLMTCGKPWIQPKPEESQKVADLFTSIFPDPEMRAGYASVLKSGLTGTRPENFTVANGGGRNGKGVINENATNCAGNYAVEGHLALLTKPIKDGPNPEAAGLHRKRLAIFSEPEDGMNEALRLSCIKKLTGCAAVS